MTDPFDSSMFVGTGAEDVTGLLAYLETHMPLMGDEDRDFVIGCKVTVETGGVITAQNKQRLVQIAQFLNATGHDVLGGAVEAPLSMPKVLQDLAQNIHTLQPHERNYANEIARKVKSNEALTPREIERILEIYYNKGF
jgi:hypothetical protein